MQSASQSVYQPFTPNQQHQPYAPPLPNNAQEEIAYQGSDGQVHIYTPPPAPRGTCCGRLYGRCKSILSFVWGGAKIVIVAGIVYKCLPILKLPFLKPFVKRAGACMVLSYLKPMNNAVSSRLTRIVCSAGQGVILVSLTPFPALAGATVFGGWQLFRELLRC